MTSIMTSTPVIHEALTDQDIIDCYPAFMELLSPRLIEETEFLTRIRRLRHTYDYRLMFIREPNSGRVASLLSFRVFEMLWSGLMLYVDHLVTLTEFRGRGYGRALMEWAADYARGIHCRQITTDSNHVRYNAHRFLLNNQFYVYAHHFVRDLN